MASSSPPTSDRHYGDEPGPYHKIGDNSVHLAEDGKPEHDDNSDDDPLRFRVESE